MIIDDKHMACRLYGMPLHTLPHELCYGLGLFRFGLFYVHHGQSSGCHLAVNAKMRCTLFGHGMPFWV